MTSQGRKEGHDAADKKKKKREGSIYEANIYKRYSRQLKAKITNSNTFQAKRKKRVRPPPVSPLPLSFLSLSVSTQGLLSCSRFDDQNPGAF